MRKNRLYVLRAFRAFCAIAVRSRIWVLLPIPVFILAALIFQNRSDIPDSISGTIFEGIFLIFSGDPPRQISESSFSLPVTWLFINAYIAFTFRTSPFEESVLHEQLMMIRTTKRETWWLVKLACMLVFVTLEYAVIYVTSIAWSLFCSDGAAAGDGALHILLAPYLTSLMFCGIQTTINLLTKPVIGFLSVIVIMVASAYYYSPIAIGNCSMLLRSKLAMESGISLYTIIFETLFVLLCCSVIGCAAVKKVDLL